MDLWSPFIHHWAHPLNWLCTLFVKRILLIPDWFEEARQQRQLPQVPALSSVAPVSEISLQKDINWQERNAFICPSAHQTGFTWLSNPSLRTRIVFPWCIALNWVITLALYFSCRLIAQKFVLRSNSTDALLWLFDVLRQLQDDHSEARLTLLPEQKNPWVTGLVSFHVLCVCMSSCAENERELSRVLWLLSQIDVRRETRF